MFWLQATLTRLRWLVDRRAVERELDDELRFHLEMETARLVEKGVPEAAARRRARLSFGSVENVKEECRDERSAHLLEPFFQDLRYGWRTLGRNPGYTAAAVLTLALGLGANAAIFSVVHGVLLEPLPYAAADRLMILRQAVPRRAVEDVRFSVPEVADYREQASAALSGLVEYHMMWFNLLGRGEPMRVQTGVVSHDFFQTLGAAPALGRVFAAADESEGAEPVLVLSHAFWQRALGGDPGVVGESFEMNDRPHTVVGVLPQVPQFPHENDVYMPTTACPFRMNPQRTERRDIRSLVLFGRLADGVSRERAEADLGLVLARLREEHPEAYQEGVDFRVRLVSLHEALTGPARPTLLLLLGTVALVLLIACANVTSLGLARLESRRRELALRASLGASRGRLLRQLLTESALLGLAGGAVGLGLATAGLELLVAYAARFTPRAAEIGIDTPVVVFTAVLSLAAGLGFGAVAALRGVRSPTAGCLEDARNPAGGDRFGLRRWLVVSQLAVAVVLMASAGLMVRTLLNLQAVDPGFDTEGVLTARIDLDWTRYDTNEKRARVLGRILAGLDGAPGVVSAALGSEIPLTERLAASSELTIEGRPVDEGVLRPVSKLRPVSPGFLSTMGIRLLEGRFFDQGDGADSPPVAVVSERLARTHWAGGSPLGKRISLDGGETWRAVVGVAADVKQASLASPVEDELYLPFEQRPRLSSRLLVRSDGDPMRLRGIVRAAVLRVDPEQPVVDFRTLAEVRRDAVAPPRLVAALLALFAALALAITAVGVGGLLAFSVSRRTREIGVRMALGAARGNVLGMVLRQGLGLVAAGLVLGVAGALAVTRLLSEQLFGVGPADPLTFFGVAAVLLAVATLTSWIPARRATAIDPMSALRSD